MTTLTFRIPPRAALAALLLALASPASAAPRTALIEVFGAPECLPCAPARFAAATVADENDTLAVWTEYHVGTTSPLGGPVPDARALDYGSPALPAIFVDGSPVVPTGAGLVQDVRDAVGAALAVPAPLEVEALLFFDPDSRLGSVIVEVTVTEDIVEASPDEIRVLIVEDPVDWCCGAMNASEWPRAARLLLDPIPLVAMTAGEQQAHQVDFDLDASWNGEALAGLAFVQRVSDRTILQAVEGRNAGTLPPLPPQPGDPDVITLFPTTPNPTVGFARLEFFLPEPTWAQLRILDVRGALVRELTNGQRTAGRHPLTWDGTDWRGRPRAAGVYFLVLETSTVRKTQRLTLLR